MGILGKRAQKSYLLFLLNGGITTALPTSVAYHKGKNI